MSETILTHAATSALPAGEALFNDVSFTTDVRLLGVSVEVPNPVTVAVELIVWRASDHVRIGYQNFGFVALDSGENVFTLAAPVVLASGVEYAVGFDWGTGGNIGSAFATTPHDHASASFDVTHHAVLIGSLGAYPTSTLTGQEMAYDYVVAVSNHLPNAPTLLSPTGGAAVNRSATLRLAHQHSDPDSDAQTAFEDRYRVVGTSPWTTVSGTTNAFFDIAAGTLTADDFEWQSRTADAEGFGPWSASAFFTAGDPPDGPVFSDLVDGGTVTTSSRLVPWTVAAQDSYQLRVVADLAGVPDTSTVVFDTGEVFEPADRQIVVPFPTDSVARHVQIRDRVGGVWSEWTSVRVRVSYTPPAAPLATAQSDFPAGAITVSIVNPTPSGDQPAVATDNVWRRELDANDVVIDGPRRIKTDVMPNGSFVDWQVASRGIYQYAAEAVAVDGATALGPWTATASYAEVTFTFSSYSVVAGSFATYADLAAIPPIGD